LRIRRDPRETDELGAVPADDRAGTALWRDESFRRKGRRSMTERSDDRERQSPLHSDRGRTKIAPSVVQQVAGIAAQEVEKVQMSGGTGAAVGSFLQSVTGSSGAGYTRGVSVEVGEEETAIDLTMAVEYGQSIPQLSEAVRRNVINRVESLLGLRVTEVNITVNDVQIPEERPMLEEQEQVEEQARRQEQQA
jgi:uncharacterized alkaline shock family protein YloU